MHEEVQNAGICCFFQGYKIHKWLFFMKSDYQLNFMSFHTDIYQQQNVLPSQAEICSNFWFSSQTILWRLSQENWKKNLPKYYTEKQNFATKWHIRWSQVEVKKKNIADVNKNDNRHLFYISIERAVAWFTWRIELLIYIEAIQ